MQDQVLKIAQLRFFQGNSHQRTSQALSPAERLNKHIENVTAPGLHAEAA
jgi:hypothetical protein